MSLKQFFFLVLGLTALLVKEMLGVGAVVMLGRVVPDLPSWLGDLVMVLDVLLQLALVVVLFLAIPPALLLHGLGIASRWAWFATGMLAGWMFLFAYFVEFRLNVLASTASVLQVPALFAGLLFADPLKFLAEFHAATSAGSFAAVMLIGGAACAFAWHGVVARLISDNNRDWQGRILGGPPPYAR